MPTSPKLERRGSQAERDHELSAKSHSASEDEPESPAASAGHTPDEPSTPVSKVGGSGLHVPETPYSDSETSEKDSSSLSGTESESKSRKAPLLVKRSPDLDASEAQGPQSHDEDIDKKGGFADLNAALSHIRAKRETLARAEGGNRLDSTSRENEKDVRFYELEMAINNLREQLETYHTQKSQGDLYQAVGRINNIGRETLVLVQNLLDDKESTKFTTVNPNIFTRFQDKLSHEFNDPSLSPLVKGVLIAASVLAFGIMGAFVGAALFSPAGPAALLGISAFSSSLQAFFSLSSTFWAVAGTQALTVQIAGAVAGAVVPNAILAGGAYSVHRYFSPIKYALSRVECVANKERKKIQKDKLQTCEAEEANSLLKNMQ